MLKDNWIEIGVVSVIFFVATLVGVIYLMKWRSSVRNANLVPAEREKRVERSLFGLLCVLITGSVSLVLILHSLFFVPTQGLKGLSLEFGILSLEFAAVFFAQGWIVQVVLKRKPSISHSAKDFFLDFSEKSIDFSAWYGVASLLFIIFLVWVDRAIS